jgi:uncharacterized protein YbjT (DUF2867 family)
MVLVNGASGFVGRHLIRALRDAGHEVAACSRSRVEQPGIFYVAPPELGLGGDRVSGVLPVGFASGYRKGGSGNHH